MTSELNSVFYLEHLQPSWFPGSWIPRIYNWMAVQLPDTLAGILVTIAIVTSLNRTISPEIILLGGLLGGVISSKRTPLLPIESDLYEDTPIIPFIIPLLISIILIFIPSLLWVCGFLLVIFFSIAEQEFIEFPFVKKVIRNGVLVGVIVGLSYGYETWQFYRYIGLTNTTSVGLGLHAGLDFGLAFGLSAKLLSILFIGENMTIQLTDRLVWTWTSLGKSLFSKFHIIVTTRFIVLIALVRGLSTGLSVGLLPSPLQPHFFLKRRGRERWLLSCFDVTSGRAGNR